MGFIGTTYRRALAVADRIFVPVENRRLRRMAETVDSVEILSSALGRGIQWFRKEEMLEISALMLLQEAYEGGREPRLAFIDDHIERYRRANPGFRERLFDFDYPYDPVEDPFGKRYLAEVSRQVFEHPLDTVMRRCLYADRLGLGAEFLEELKSLDDNGGYGTTHIVVGGRLLKRFSRIPHHLLDAEMQLTVPRILKAQRFSRSGDIFAERIVVLQWLGREDVVDPAWLFRLARAQLPDGGWSGRPGLRRPTANQHTTALAIVALAQALGAPRRGVDRGIGAWGKKEKLGGRQRTPT